MLNEELIARAKNPVVLYVDVFPFQIDEIGEVQYLIFKRRSDVVMPNVWQPICGKISKGQSIKEAFSSQVTKKTNLIPVRFQPIDNVTIYYDHHYDSVMLVPSVGAEIPMGKIILDVELHCECRWVQFDTLHSYIPFQGQRKSYALLNATLTNTAY